MNRPSPRRPTNIQGEAAPPRKVEASPLETAPADEAGVGLGWRIAIVVWLAGFLGLALFELGGLVLGLLRR